MWHTHEGRVGGHWPLSLFSVSVLAGVKCSICESWMDGGWWVCEMVRELSGLWSSQICTI